MGAPLNLVGQRFHMLVVTERIPSSQTQKIVKWKCRCDCGNICEKTTGELRRGEAYSCGCYRKQIIKRITDQPIRPKLGMVNNTNVSRISSNKPSKNNKLGMRGVSMTKHGTYAAFIYYKGQRTYLGTYRTPEGAKAVYDEAWKERTKHAAQEGSENDNTWQGRKKIDLTGSRCGKLVVLGRAERDKYWRCQCDCGNVCEKHERYLVNQRVLSCGCKKRELPYEDLTGRKFGMLTVVERVDGQRWRCRCDCGKEAIVLTYHLKSGHTKSCGCLQHRKRKPNPADNEE